MIHPIPIGTEPNIQARYISPTLLPTKSNTPIIKIKVKIDSTPVTNAVNLMPVMFFILPIVLYYFLISIPIIDKNILSLSI